jgi:protein gp37
VSENSAISWTNSSWNPVTGCTRVSAGCAHCYAERFAERWRGIPGHAYEQGFDLKLWPERLQLPLRWRAPRMVFVNSMSDLFHERVPEDHIRQVFAVMKQAERHTFQVLTKRSERMRQLADSLEWPTNVWLGVTIESEDYVARADDLRQVPAAVRFISAEPLLGSLDSLDLVGIDWLIVGGESGPGRRCMRPEWAAQLRDRCREGHVAFYFKQWGGSRPTHEPPALDGEIWREMPVDVRSGSGDESLTGTYRASDQARGRPHAVALPLPLA